MFSNICVCLCSVFDHVSKLFVESVVNQLSVLVHLHVIRNTIDV